MNIRERAQEWIDRHSSQGCTGFTGSIIIRDLLAEIARLEDAFKECHTLYEQSAVRYFELGGDVMSDYNQNITRNEHVDCPDFRDKASAMLWHCEKIAE